MPVIIVIVLLLVSGCSATLQDLQTQHSTLELIKGISITERIQHEINRRR